MQQVAIVPGMKVRYDPYWLGVNKKNKEPFKSRRGEVVKIEKRDVTVKWVDGEVEVVKEAVLCIQRESLRKAFAQREWVSRTNRCQKS